MCENSCQNLEYPYTIGEEGRDYVIGWGPGKVSATLTRGWSDLEMTTKGRRSEGKKQIDTLHVPKPVMSDIKRREKILRLLSLVGRCSYATDSKFYDRLSHGFIIEREPGSQFAHIKRTKTEIYVENGVECTRERVLQNFPLLGLELDRFLDAMINMEPDCVDLMEEWRATYEEHTANKTLAVASLNVE